MNPFPYECDYLPKLGIKKSIFVSFIVLRLFYLFNDDDRVYEPVYNSR